jgi:hypothetical protein
MSGNGVMRSPPRYFILIANRGHWFGVFTLGPENDLPLPIGMPVVISTIENAPTLQTTAKR